MYCVQCIVYTIQCIVYTIQCIVYTIQCIVYSVHYTLYSVLYIVHYTLYSVYIYLEFIGGRPVVLVSSAGSLQCSARSGRARGVCARARASPCACAVRAAPWIEHCSARASALSPQARWPS